MTWNIFDDHWHIYIYIYIYIYNKYRALLLRIEHCKTEKSKQKTSYIYIYTLQLHVINSGSSVLGTTSIRTLTIRVYLVVVVSFIILAL